MRLMELKLKKQRLRLHFKCSLRLQNQLRRGVPDELPQVPLRRPDVQGQIREL